MAENQSNESFKNLPLFDQIEINIKETGQFKTELKKDDISSIMKSVVDGLLKENDSVKAEVTQMDVSLIEKQGGIKGKVVIKEPIKANLDIVIGLQNKPGNANSIELQEQGLKVKIDAGFFAKTALNLLDIEGKAKTALSDPNETLLKAMQKKLESKGVSLTGINLQFSNETLTVSLTGSKKSH